MDRGEFEIKGHVIAKEASEDISSSYVFLDWIPTHQFKGGLAPAESGQNESPRIL